jgi:hypothetical protein
MKCKTCGAEPNKVGRASLEGKLRKGFHWEYRHRQDGPWENRLPSVAHDIVQVI